jgi:hypothetical protein
MMTIYAGSIYGQQRIDHPSTQSIQKEHFSTSEHHETEQGQPKATAAPTDAQQLQSVIEGQLQAIRLFDPSRAYYAYTSKEFRKSTPLDEFKRFVKKFAVLYMNQSMRVENVSFKEGIGVCKVKLIAKNGETKPVEYIFIQEDGHWVILSIKVTI